MEDFEKRALEINVELNEKKIKQFNLYKELLKQWNEKMNLTAITEDNEIMIKHFIDSLTIIQYVEDNSKIIDVGTGAGFPGIPLKIANESINLTLMDSLNKRLIFLDEVKKTLELNNVEMLHGRAEDIGKMEKYREKYDVVTARAVANMAVLLEYCLPLVKVGGRFICMKGNNLEDELEYEKALKTFGGEIEKVEKICLPGTEIERNIIVIKKVMKTPKQYPRKAGVPTKKPIK